MSRSRQPGVGTTVLGVCFVLTTMAAGAMCGGAFVRFFMPRAADGWTGIARGLGGLMSGAAVGLVLALVVLPALVRRGPRITALAAGAAALLALAVFLVIYLASGPRRGQRDGAFVEPGGSVVISGLGRDARTRATCLPSCK